MLPMKTQIISAHRLKQEFESSFERQIETTTSDSTTSVLVETSEIFENVDQDHEFFGKEWLNVQYATGR